VTPSLGGNEYTQALTRPRQLLSEGVATLVLLAEVHCPSQESGARFLGAYVTQD